MMDWLRRMFFPRSVAQDQAAEHVHAQFDRLRAEIRNASTDDLIASLVHNKHNQDLKKALEE